MRETGGLTVSSSRLNRLASPQLTLPSDLDKALPPLPCGESDRGVRKQISPCAWLSPLSRAKASETLPNKEQADGGRLRSRLFFRKKRKADVMQEDEIKDPAITIKYVGIDKGTQTDPVLVVDKYPVKGMQKSQSRIGPNIRPRALRFPSDAESDRGLSSPLWSPRLDASLKNAQDYFVLPTAAENDNVLPKRFERTQLPHQDGRAKTLSIANRSAPPTPMYNRDESADTLGTYESRYSSRSSDRDFMQEAHHDTTKSPRIEAKVMRSASIQKVENAARPTLRTCSSEETVQIRPKHSRGVIFNNSSEGRVVEDRPIGMDEKIFVPEPSLKRFKHSPRLCPLYQMTVQKKKHLNKSQSSDNAQESSRHEQSDDTMDLSTPDEDMAFYNVRLEDYPEDVAQGQDVPDHFSGSPICPMHPKHKSGGLGICPMHGRKKTNESAAKSIPSPANSSKADTPPTGSTTSKEFSLGVSEHQKSDPNCPANIMQESGKYGVCPIHGRGRDRDADKLLRLL